MSGRLSRYAGTVVVAAVVGALAAGTPSIAGSVVDFARHAGNANKVGGISASRTPRPGALVPLNARGVLPTSVVPAGARAATGPAGVTGPAGPAGAVGSRGDTGATGAKGETGPAAPKGDTGAAGAAGASGDAGAKGEAGAQGAKGETGAAGAKGDIGPAGPNGDAGAAGPNGDTGAAGPKGDTGAPGTAGAAGAAGPTGDAGPQGVPGAPGAQGDKGEPGAVGAKGDKGDAGAPGEKGDPGAQGPKGDKGEPGAAGGVYFPAIVDINPIPVASRESGWDRIWMDGRSVNGGYRSSCCTAGVTTNFVEWDVALGAGDWKLEAIYATDHDGGIMTFSLDGADIGQVDGYGAQSFNNRALLPVFHVDSPGTHALRVRLDAKNPDSGDYYGFLAWVRLVVGPTDL